MRSKRATTIAASRASEIAMKQQKRTRTPASENSSSEKDVKQSRDEQSTRTATPKTKANATAVDDSKRRVPTPKAKKEKPMLAIDRDDVMPPPPPAQAKAKAKSKDTSAANKGAPEGKVGKSKGAPAPAKTGQKDRLMAASKRPRDDEETPVPTAKKSKAGAGKAAPQTSPKTPKITTTKVPSVKPANIKRAEAKSQPEGKPQAAKKGVKAKGGSGAKSDLQETPYTVKKMKAGAKYAVKKTPKISANAPPTPAVPEIEVYPDSPAPGPPVYGSQYASVGPGRHPGHPMMLPPMLPPHPGMFNSMPYPGMMFMGGPGGSYGGYPPPATPAGAYFSCQFWGQSLHLALQQVEDRVVVGGFTKINVNPMMPGIPGEAEASGRVQVGDTVVAVNGSEVGMNVLDNVVDILKTSPRPVLVTFRRALSSELQRLTQQQDFTGTFAITDDPHVQGVTGPTPTDPSKSAKKRGRPPKNPDEKKLSVPKVKKISAAAGKDCEVVKRPRGRPPKVGSKAAAKTTPNGPKRKPGRPPGSTKKALQQLYKPDTVMASVEVHGESLNLSLHYFNGKIIVGGFTPVKGPNGSDRGEIEKSNVVEIGDLLYAINEKPLIGFAALKDCADLIKNTPRPMVLGFQRPGRKGVPSLVLPTTLLAEVPALRNGDNTSASGSAEAKGASKKEFTPKEASKPPTAKVPLHM